MLVEAGQALASRHAEAGRAVSFFPLDLADPASVARFVAEAAGALGGIDGLINNAAITNSGGTRRGRARDRRPGTR